jgi:hypothetical protein
MHETTLTNAIVAAFSEVPYPGDDNLTPKKPYLDLESDQIAEFLKGKRWQQLNAEYVWSEYQGDPGALLTFMTPEAFQYYLPAFLLMSILEYEKADVMADSVLYNLRPRDQLDEERFKERFDRLTLDQRKSVAATLRSLEEKHGGSLTLPEVRDALDQIWRPYR